MNGDRQDIGRISVLASLRVFGVAMLVSLCLTAILLLASDVRTRLGALERASSDNTQWVIMQTEVEVLRMLTAVLQAEATGAMTGTAPDLSEVRRWFNILYSRIGMLEQSKIYAPQLLRGGYVDDHRTIRGFLDRTLPLIDGPDDALYVALPALADDLGRVRAAARQMTLASLSDTSAMADLQRNSISSTLLRLALLTGALILVLGLLALVMGRLYRTSRLQAAELRKTGARLQTIVGHSADGISVVDRAGRIVEFNPTAEAIFGIPRAEALGHDALSLLAPGLDPDLAERLRALMSEDIPADRPLRIEVEARRHDEDFPAELSVATTGPDDGRLIVVFIRDISERKRAERDLTEARDRALAGEQAKARFLAVMSHEMRTPLNGLIGSMDLLSDTPLDAEQVELLEVMATSGQILLRHVNSVLDLSRAEAGIITLDPAVFDFEKLVAGIVANQQGLATAAGNEIRTVAVDGPIGRVRGDRGRIEQVLLNLVGNAVKFTRNGQITIETERLGDLSASGVPLVEIRVADTGRGIAEADLPRVFEDFVTLDSSYSRSAGGTGLGLGISRRLTEAMDGKIGVESVEGEGSVFWLRLPLPHELTAEAATPTLTSEGAETAETGGDMASPRATGTATRPAPAAPGSGSGPEPQPESGPESGAGLSILVIEDNDINRFLLRRYLGGAGHRVVEAIDGVEGVAAAEAAAYDVILTDISMPRMDGVEAVRRIRAGDGPSAKARIIALTAHALPEETARFRAAGMDECLTKPIVRHELLRLVGSVDPVLRVAQTDGAEPILDHAVLSELTEQIGASTTAMLLGRLVAEGDEMMANCRTKRLPEDRADLVRCAHTLAGTCGTFGTRRLRLSLARFELAAGGAEPDLDEAAALMHSIPTLWAETRAMLDTVRADLAHQSEAAE